MLTAKYIARFQEYTNITIQKGDALLTIYQQGLKESVKDELIRYKRVINNLEQLIKTTIEINNKLYKKAIEKYYNNLYSRVGTYVGRLEYYRGKPKF